MGAAARAEKGSTRALRLLQYGAWEALGAAWTWEEQPRIVQHKTGTNEPAPTPPGIP